MALPEADYFKEEFKRYKKKNADLRDVIDFTRPQRYEKEVRKLITSSCEVSTCIHKIPAVYATADSVARCG